MNRFVLAALVLASGSALAAEPTAATPFEINPRTGGVAGYELLNTSKDSAHNLFVNTHARINEMFGAGLGASVRLSPEGGFDRIVGRGLYAFPTGTLPGAGLGVTADLGLFRYQSFSFTNGIENKYGPIIGLGARVLYPVGQGLTVFTQRPWMVAPAGDPFFGNAGDNVLQFSVASETYTSVGVPIGVHFAINDMFGIAGRTGFRAVFGGGSTETFVPLGADLIVNIPGGLRATATFELPGHTSDYTGFRFLSFTIGGTLN